MPFLTARWSDLAMFNFAVHRRRELIRYEVTHPVWRCFTVVDFDLRFDFAALYGARRRLLNGRRPESVLLAEGCEIAVHWPRE